MMEAFETSLGHFVQKWTSSRYPPVPVCPADLERAEHELGIRFPCEYREAMLSVGVPQPTIALLNSICEWDLAVQSVSDFYDPKQIVKETLAWRELGMPEQLVAIAGDGGGNQFCFDSCRLATQSYDKGALWLFDHEFGEIELVAIGFDAWIAAFCEIEPISRAETS